MEHQSRRPAENDRRTERTPQEAARRTDGPLPVQAALEPALSAVPPAATYAALLVFTADAAVSLRLLGRTGDPAILSLRALRSA